MLLLLASALLVVCAVSAACSFRLGVAGSLLAAYLVASAVVILGAEVLSPYHWIGPYGYLVWEAIVAGGTVALWRRTGWARPHLPRVTGRSLRRHPVVVGLGGAVVLGLVLELVLATTTVPNNWDAMTYHLSRAAAWYQRGSLGFFSAHTPRENIFPANAEIQVLYTMVFTHGDRLAGLPQFIAEIALLVGIFGIARRLGFGRPDAVFSALLFATLSEVALEATSAQNDLVVSAYVVAAAYFILGRSRRELGLAAAAIGLGLGTKMTALYALPLVGLLALFVLPRRRAAWLAVTAAVAFAALGSLVYIENVVKYGTPLGSKAERAPGTPAITAGGTVSTMSRVLYDFADLSGYKPDIRLRVTLLNTGSFVFRRLGIDPDPPAATLTPFSFFPNDRDSEDLSYFGPLGAFLVVPLLLGYLGMFVLRRTTRVKAALALALPVFVLEIALTNRYNAWLGRFMIIPVALGAALFARAYAARLVSTLFAVTGVVFLALALTHNERKPIGLDATTAIWSLDRASTQGLARPGFAATFEAVGTLVPQQARLGVLLGDDDFDYPLYGVHLTRHLIPLPTNEPLRTARSLHLDWVVLGDVPARVGAGWTAIHLYGHWTLAAPSGTPAARRIIHYVQDRHGSELEVDRGRPDRSSRLASVHPSKTGASPPLDG